MTRARIAADEIRQKSGNGNVVVKKLNLASLQSVRDLAKDVEKTEERLDILINNAGISIYSAENKEAVTKKSVRLNKNVFSIEYIDDQTRYHMF